MMHDEMSLKEDLIGLDFDLEKLDGLIEVKIVLVCIQFVTLTIIAGLELYKMWLKKNKGQYGLMTVVSH
jgi:hypothetical protein